MELIGTKGRARLLNDVFTTVYVERAGELTSKGGAREWTPIPENPTQPVAGTTAQVAANRIVVDDWLNAIAEKREPVCSGWAAMKSLEMIHAVFAAGVSGRRIALPLANRTHPLAG